MIHSDDQMLLTTSEMIESMSHAGLPVSETWLRRKRIGGSVVVRRGEKTYRYTIRPVLEKGIHYVTMPGVRQALYTIAGFNLLRTLRAAETGNTQHT